MIAKFTPILFLCALILGILAIGVDLIGDLMALRSIVISACLVCLLLSFGMAIVARGLFGYVFKRLAEAGFVLWLIVSVTFLLLRFLPGGPFDSEKALPPEVKANIEAKYHLNDPLSVQYKDYLSGLLHGDLGESYKYLGREVSEILMDSFPNSIRLGLYAMCLAFLIGIPLGILAAKKHGTWIDSASMIAAMSGVALPSFLIAPILILIFSFWLGWLPPALWEGPEYYILPVITLGLRPAAIIARMTRSSALEVIKMDFVRTARAKGLSEWTVLFKHVLRNSLLPVLTVSGPLMAQLFSGAFIIELIFAIPGMGKHFIDSVTNRDYPVVLGATIVFAVMLVIANLVVDLLYSIVDPRIQIS